MPGAGVELRAARRKRNVLILQNDTRVRLCQNAQLWYTSGTQNSHCSSSQFRIVESFDAANYADPCLFGRETWTPVGSSMAFVLRWPNRAFLRKSLGSSSFKPSSSSNVPTSDFSLWPEQRQTSLVRRHRPRFFQNRRSFGPPAVANPGSGGHFLRAGGDLAAVESGLQGASIELLRRRSRPRQIPFETVQ